MAKSLPLPTGIREQAFRAACDRASEPRLAWRRLALAASPAHCMGLVFPNRLGIAAGFDRQGILGRAAGNLGFGAIELGGWTPHNWPEPALASHPAPLLDTRLGIRLAAITTESAAQETRQLTRLIERAWHTADYLSIAPEWLTAAVPAQQRYASLRALRTTQQALTLHTGKSCPIVYKFRLIPGRGDALTLVRGLADQGVDGILLCFDFGKPFTAAHYRRWQDREFQATTCRILEACRRHLTGATALLTNGGVYCRQDYRDRLQAGADLVQLHNALVFEGPAIGWQISP
ncbi:hypothetical protein [Marinobacter sp.]|uniref:hypothetical protein n=1 Tax=Marinobacter sp. TaxID=50741 RepID=UPI0023578783|nr:hypothetical protein [Marinobacter sp.]